MNLSCSEDIRRKLKLGENAESDNPFYTWSARIVTFLETETLVVVNNKAPIGFILFGLTPVILRYLDCYIREGIRKCLTQGYISPVRIQQYLARCGSQLSYAGPVDQSSASSLNTFITRIMDMGELTKEEPSDSILFQSHLVGFINGIPHTSSSHFFTPMDIMRREFDLYIPDMEFYPPSDKVVLNIYVMGVPCARQLQVPLNLSLEKLHQMMQSAFGWCDYSYHHFHSLNDENLEMLFPDDSCEEHITLAQMLSLAPAFHYIYNESQEWTILVEQAEQPPDYSQTSAYCLAAFGNPEYLCEHPGTCDDYIPPTHEPKTYREDFLVQLRCILEQEPIDPEIINLRLRLIEQA